MISFYTTWPKNYILLLDSWASQALYQRWATIGSYAVAWFFWNKIDQERFSELFALSTASLYLVVRVLTSHCHIGAVKLPDANFRNCIEEDEVEKFQQFLLNCPTIVRSRLKHFGAHTFRYPTEMVGIEIKCLTKFVLTTKGNIIRQQIISKIFFHSFRTDCI